MGKSVLLVVTLLLVLSLPVALFAQTGTVAGRVTDAETGESLVGANVFIVGTSMGSAAGMDGTFRIVKVPVGTYELKVSFMGYKEQTVEIKVTANASVSVNVKLESEIILGSAISVLADRAKLRETPVAFSNVAKADMEQRLGSRDIPLVLNTTPSVYATMQGGGAGDARINIRGFNQRNFAVMINGVPVNDMENGWVYWSNWDGLGDATSSIQVQRGLSAVNIATPSIGGTMNIITDPTALGRGVRYKQEFGNDGFLKSTLSAHTGLIDGKYAISGNIVRKTGDGLIDATWTDAWAYYLGASYAVNKNNRLEFYAMGAPQRHGQNLYRQNIAVYDKAFAEDLEDYDPEAFDKYHEVGRKFNQNWAPVSSSYTGQQNFNEANHDRHASDFINSRENFFHKPIVNLNWYSNLTEKLNLFTTLYWSGGHGGGTGTYGKPMHQSFEGPYDNSSGKFYYFGSPWRWDWDATIAMNRDSTHALVDKKEYNKEKGQSLGILRNSRNNQWTVGLLSKVNYQVSDAIKTTFGIDWRTAEIDHFREVRDLLGGTYFDPRTVGEKTSDFWSESEMKRGLGDKVAYDFTNTVDWFGVFGQGEYSSGPITAYGMGGYSIIKYTYTNHFTKGDDGNELFAESDNIGGYQVKGGASYRFTDALHAYGNAGWVSKVPIFDNVINDRDGTKADNPKNEQFVNLEAGVNFWGLSNKLSVKAGFYYTSWKDRAYSRGITNQDGSEGIIFLSGMNTLHSGVELEAAYMPIKLVRLDIGASVGNWVYTDDVSGVYKDYASGGVEEKEFNFYVKDLKSGDAPQTQLSIVGSLFPLDGLMVQGILRHYQNHYANWDPFSRTNEKTPAEGGDRGVESWKAPNYSVVDLHASYNLPISLGGVGVQLFAHVFNALDATFIQDATDNSHYNAFDKDHDADDAEVFFGLPRSFNVGLSLSY